MKCKIFLLAAILLFSAFAQATDIDTLREGSPAPSLQGATWIKGDKITTFKKGHVYVIEFWATWCGPCRMAMPHLSELANEYEGKVTVISFNSQELAYAKEKDLDYFSRVKEFVRKLGDGMDYNVAIDGDEKILWKNWMTAAGLKSIPRAFIIGKDQRIAWIGHPDTMDEVLAAVVDNNYDEAQKQKIAAGNTDYHQRMAPLSQRLREAMKQKDYTGSVLIADTLLSFLKPSDVTYISTTRLMALSHVDQAAAREYGEKLIVQLRRDPITLYSVGRDIIDEDVATGFKPDYQLGLKFIQAAASRSDSLDQPVLSALAKAHFRMGNVKEAVRIQQQAVNVTRNNKFFPSSEGTRQRAEKALEEYKTALIENR